MSGFLQQMPANNESTRSSLAMSEEIRPVFAILRKRWKWICIGFAIALAVGLAARSQYGDRQEYTGVILHTPLSAGEASKHIIPVADLKSLSTLVKAPESLQTVVKHQQLDLSPQALADHIEVKTIPGSQTLGIGLQWRGPGNGEAILDSIMKEFITRAGEIRRRRMEERAADFNTARAECERDLQTGRVELMAFYRKNDVLDLPHELRNATAELDVLATTLSLSCRNEANGKAQLESLDKTIDRLTRQGAAVAGVSSTPARLQQMITEERLREQAQTRLEIKRRELDRIQKVIAKGAASNVEFDRVSGEIAALQSTANDNEKILEWKKDLAEIERTANMPPLLQQAFAKKLDLDLLLLGFRNELPLLIADHDAKQQRVERLLKLQAEAAPLIWQVERAEAERNRMQAHLDQIRVLLAMSGGEATVYQSAAAVAKPLGGARSWLMPVAVGGCAFLLWLWAIIACSPRREERTNDTLATDLGLSILAHLPAGVRAPEAAPQVRSLALSLRQRLPRAGTAILFSPVRGGAHTHELLLQTATCLAERDERVLILDAGLSESTRPACPGECGRENANCQCHLGANPAATRVREIGLSNYLAFEVVRPSEVVQPTAVFGVDFLPAGTSPISPDALATHRMRDLLGQLRQTYSIILVAGPPVGSATDLQILAAYQDGAVILFDVPNTTNAYTQELFRNYRKIGVPFLGCVHLAG